MTAWLERIAADPDLFAAAIFGGGLLAIALSVALWFAVFGRDERRMHRRIERVQSPATGRSQGQAAVDSVKRQRKDSSIASLDRLLKRALPNGNVMRLRLERSGLPLAVGDYLLICLGLGIVITLMMFLVYDFALIVNLSVGILAGLGVPHFVVGFRTKQRVKKFQAQLPDALDLIVRGIRSGLPVTEAINTIGQEIQDPVGTEFRQVSDQVRIGVNLDEALWTSARRLQIPEFNFLVISMAIQQETGGNLAEILEKLADMVRRREQMRLKIKAMSSEARASAMIIGVLHPV
jgi:tight adherence protein B